MQASTHNQADESIHPIPNGTTNISATHPEVCAHIPNASRMGLEKVEGVQQTNTTVRLTAYSGQGLIYPHILHPSTTPVQYFVSILEVL